MLLLIENLGREYIVWDRNAAIHFKAPGKGLVNAKFYISEERYSEIKKRLETEEKIYPEFSVDILDKNNTIVATIEKTLYIKKKNRK